MSSLQEDVKFFFLQSWMSYRALFSWLNPLAYGMIKIISPILQMIFFSLLAGYVFNTKDISPWIIGNSILLCSKNAVYGVGSVLKEERFMGTLRLIVASPANKFTVFIGRSFMHIFDALITVTVGLLVGAICFGFKLPADRLLLFTIILLISLYSAMAIGQLISCVGLITRDVHLLLNVSEYVLLILTGASFPLSRLPETIQWISRVLPITRGIEAARIVAESGANTKVWQLMAQEFLIGSIYLIAGYILFSYFEKCSRIQGTLDMY